MNINAAPATEVPSKNEAVALTGTGDPETTARSGVSRAICQAGLAIGPTWSQVSATELPPTLTRTW